MKANPTLVAVFAWLAILGAPAAVSTAGAGDLPSPEERLSTALSEIDSAVNLSDDQEAEVRAILEEQAAKQKDAIESAQTDGDMANLRKSIEAIREETHESIEAVLTDDQMEAYGALLEEQRAEREDQMQTLMVEYQVDALRDRLELSDEQTSQVEAIISETWPEKQERLQGLRTGRKLQKLRKMKDFQSFQEDIDSRVRAVLDSEQQAEYAAYREEQKAKLQEMRESGGK
jgi:hypothetical protein